MPANSQDASLNSEMCLRIQRIHRMSVDAFESRACQWIRAMSMSSHDFFRFAERMRIPKMSVNARL